MIFLKEINESNWIQVAGLSPTEVQKNYVASAIGILARAYVYRDCRAVAYAIYNDEIIVGIAMIRDMNEEPKCYELQQFFIDKEHQGKGFGTEALREIIELLKSERKYSSIEVCVKMEDLTAIHLYEKLGFVDTGYIDADVPDSCNLVYRF